jgi:hypothetical protein
MTEQLAALYDAFTDEDIPYAYNVFPTDEPSPALPYVTAFVSGGQGVMADDENYYDQMTVNVLLFTKTKDPATEDKVREILKSLECPYSWDETYATDEKMYVITYQITMEA